MPSVHPAMKGNFGSTEYFMITMKAKDVASQLDIPKDMPDWSELELEERFQREINFNRVRKLIAPYLANDPDRFFGALIVDVLNPEGMKFEPLDNVLPSRNVPQLYQTAAQAFGFLTLSGGEVLVPLDGQHRLAAIKFALSGIDERGDSIEGVNPNTDLANDDVLLIMIEHDDSSKGRKIFNKVNRYAKPTSKAENLITADDDIIAVIARDISNELVGSRLVNYKSNTLSDKAPQFTTLSTIYESTRSILEESFGKISTVALPSPAEQNLYRSTAKDHWERILKGVTVFDRALIDGEESGDQGRRDIRRTILLGKPVAQLTLVQAIVRLLESDMGDGSRLSWDDVLTRVNDLDWRNDNPIWQNVLLLGTRVVSGKTAVNFASRFISYYLGEPLSSEQVGQLTDLYRVRFPEGNTVDLPSSLY